MKVIIAGSRTITDPSIIQKAIASSKFPITEIISGGARGVDTLAASYACKKKLDLTIMPAKWHLYGKAAGPIRNAEMAKLADGLIAIWDGKSKGTFNMIQLARREKLAIHIHRVCP